MIKILISHCLLGENCKYNGRNNFRDYLAQIQDKVEFIPVCPEVMGGLPTPRIPSEIIADKVFNEIDLDVTRNYLEGAKKALANGTSIVIGHVGAEGGEQTAKAIRDTLPEIEKLGVEIVPLSEIYNIKLNQK